MNGVAKYFSNLSDEFGRGWNAFWFTPADPFPLGLLRIFVGAISTFYLLSYSFDLVRWFGPNGLLTAATVHQFMSEEVMSRPQSVFRFSHLYFTDAPAVMWTFHVAALIVAVLFTIGLFTRITNILTLLFVLSYVHRAALVTGEVEPVLTMALLYLSLGPAGAWLSVDRWLKSRRQMDTPPVPGIASSDSPSWTAGVSLRLLQVHLAGLYLMIALTKLGGPGTPDSPSFAPWWQGTAVWWLMARPESRLVDLTFVHPYVFMAWTHAILLFELTFPILIWNRLARPLLLGLSVVMWCSLALITGLVSYCLLMILAGVAFIPGESLRAICGTCCGGTLPTAPAAPVSVAKK